MSASDSRRGGCQLGCLNAFSAIMVALVGIMGVLGAAIINNPDSLCKISPKLGSNCDSGSTSNPPGGVPGPIRIQAESHDTQSQAFSNEPSGDPQGGGSALGYINDGSWVGYNGVDFGSGNYHTFRARVASDLTGGRITVKLGGSSGHTVSICDVFNTGGWEAWQTVECPLENGIKGVNDIYLVFNGGSPWLINVNWFEFSS